MKKFLAMLLCVILCASCFTVIAEETPIKVAVVYSATVDDKGWCQAMDSGIKNAIAQGCSIDYTPIETVAVTDAESILNRLAGNYDIIIAHGAQFQNAITAAAEENTDQVFAMGTSELIIADNVFTYMPASEEPGYINGYMAGLLTKTGMVGVAGSADSGDSRRYVRGFVMGFKDAYGSDGKSMVIWTGNFNDTIVAGDNAGIMIDAGCDVLTGSSQQAVGALRRVASASNVLWTSQTLAQMNDFPEVTVCAADYEYAAVIIDLVKKFQSGVTGGECIIMNYSNGGFVFQFTNNESLLPADVKTSVEEVLQKITANPGSIDYESVVLE